MSPARHHPRRFAESLRVAFGHMIPAAGLTRAVLLATQSFPHAAQRSTRYPQTLIITSWDDEQVVPMHAYL